METEEAEQPVKRLESRADLAEFEKATRLRGWRAKHVARFGKICYHHISVGGCKLESKCDFLHPDVYARGLVQPPKDDQ